MQNSPLVVVPALNEQATIRSVVSAIKKLGYDVVVVDDGSGDKTAELASQAGAIVLRMKLNLGVGGALRCGFRYAINEGYDAVIQCDADGQHPESHLKELVNVWKSTSAHLVIGSRFRDTQDSMRVAWHRRFAMYVLGFIASRACKTRITDSTSGFRLIAKPLLNEFAKSFPSHYLGDTFEANVVAGRAGYKVKEIGVPIIDRKVGKSSTGSGRSVILILRSVLVVVFGLHFNIGRFNPQANRHPSVKL